MNNISDIAFIGLSVLLAFSTFCGAEASEAGGALCPEQKKQSIKPYKTELKKVKY